MMNAYIAGAISGALATAPMTLFMSYSHRKLPRKEQYPLPPRNITMKIAKEAGIKNTMEEDEKFLLTMVNHFGYGAGAGALFYPISKHLHMPKATSGMIFGLGVWAISYMGLLPVIRLYPIATKIPFRRNLLMIAAHVVWGASLGMIADNLCHRQKIAGFTPKPS